MVTGAGVWILWVLPTYYPGSAMFDWIAAKTGADPTDPEVIKNGLTLSKWLYEIVPGFAAALVAIIIVSALTRRPANAAAA
jgi:Na+/proline symporter